jgi:uncharacterized repeat protein (TIGR01451 family)
LKSHRAIRNITISGMKDFLNLRMLALVVAGLMAACARVGAQGFGLSVTASANSILVNSPLTYTINVTNLTTLPLTDAQVTNLLPASVQFVSANPGPGSYTTNGSVVVFDLGAFTINGIAQLTLTVQPTATGFITNMVTVASITVTNTAFTNVVVQVTNAVTQADLGVAITGPAQPVITNDWMTYGVTVTNAGPNAAPNVMLTNTLPPGVGFKSVSPASPAPSIVGSNIVFNLGTLASGAFTNFLLTVQPTNAGVLTFSSFVSSASVPDPNPANNSASTNITVTNYLSGQLIVFTNSAQIYNMQNNLVEQSITVTNAGTNSVDAVRVVVAGLTNRLFNAVGTNNGNPFVVCSAALNTNQSVKLLLQCVANNYFPFTNSQLQAFAVTPPNLAAPLAVAVSTNLDIISIVRLSSGRMLIWFPSISNRTYTVVYSSDLSATNWLMAQPSVVAPATFTEWIDYGPPATVSTPVSTSNRFYRVFLNP